MPTNPHGESGACSKTEAVAGFVFAVGLLASLAVLVHPWFEPVRDGAIYLSTSRALAAGEGYHYLGIPFITRPPGFPLLLVPVLAAAGTDFYLLNLYVALWGALAVGLLFLLSRPYLGWPLALLTAAAVWLNPGFRRLSNQVMADVPGTALALACLLLDRWASRRSSWRRELALGLAIGAAASVRSMNVLLVPAILASRLAARSRSPESSGPWSDFAWRRLALVPFAAGLILVPWAVRNRWVAPPPPADQVSVYSYGAAMWHVDHGDPTSPRVSWHQVAERIPLRIRQLTDVVGSRFRLERRGNAAVAVPLVPLHAAVTLLLLAGLGVAAWKRAAPAELFALGSLLLLLVYFGFIDRLALPLYILALAATVEMLRDLLRRLTAARVAAMVVAAALVLSTAVDFEYRHGWKRIEAQHRRLVHRVDEVAGLVEPDAVLASGHGFAYGVLLDKPVYSLRIALRRSRDVAAIEKIIDKYGIDTLILSLHDAVDREILRYVRETYDDGTTTGDATMLVQRVRP